MARHLEIELGIVDQNQQVGVGLVELFLDNPHCALDITPVSQYFDQPNNRNDR